MHTMKNAGNLRMKNQGHADKNDTKDQGNSYVSSYMWLSLGLCVWVRERVQGGGGKTPGGTAREGGVLTAGW